VKTIAPELSQFNRVRQFAVSALCAIAGLNCALAYFGQKLAADICRVAIYDNTKLSVFSEYTLKSQSCFYLVALAAVFIISLALARRLSDSSLIYLVVGFLAVDIVGLIVSLWGVSSVYFLL
jgi:hypothetical protein